VTVYVDLETKTSPAAKEDAMKLLAPTLAALALSAFSLAPPHGDRGRRARHAATLAHSAPSSSMQNQVVNVKHGETVRFVAAARITWTLTHVFSFELNRWHRRRSCRR